jgi:hypothetical protein
MTHCPQTGKVCYPSENKARMAHRKIGERLRGSGSKSKRKRWESRPYRCRECGAWHLTSNIMG